MAISTIKDAVALISTAYLDSRSIKKRDKARSFQQAKGINSKGVDPLPVS